jgi:hypothetical protein
MQWWCGVCGMGVSIVPASTGSSSKEVVYCLVALSKSPRLSKASPLRNDLCTTGGYQTRAISNTATSIQTRMMHHLDQPNTSTLQSGFDGTNSRLIKRNEITNAMHQCVCDTYRFNRATSATSD